MKTSTIIWAVIVLIIIVGAGWYWYAMQTPASPSPTGETTTNTSPSGLDYTPNDTPDADINTTAGGEEALASVVLKNSSSANLGSFIVAADGMTLYTYSKDTPGTSNCSGQCATNWPPYTTTATRFTAAAGIGGSISTITRADGTHQITYKGQPLYFYINDANPGDTKGQGVGSVWYVVKP